jgi:hypothetical protein
VARDKGRLARFEREAKLLASFSHQNIATLHGLEEPASRSTRASASWSWSWQRARPWPRGSRRGRSR